MTQLAEAVAVRAGPSAHAASCPEHVDVLIVGAGISGIGGAHHLQEQCPGRSFVVLEAQDGFGGTWRTHRYPGIRSDSDLYTFGYRFKPWVGPPIATAPEILNYMGEVIDEDGLDRHIRYGHRIVSAQWDRRTARWTHRGASAAMAANGALHRELPVDVPGLLPARGRLHAATGRAWTASAAASCIRRPGRRTSTTPASAWW